MTYIEWGPAIEVNGVRPDWLRDGDKVNPAWHYDGAISEYGYEVKDNRKIVCVEKLAHIRLAASHPYYLATSRGFTYWPGGDSAPADWDGGDVLDAYGSVNGPDWIGRWTNIGDGYHNIIGYRKRTEQPAIALELVERMVAFVRECAGVTNVNSFDLVDSIRDDANAILAELTPPDPDLTLAKSIMGDADAIALAIKAARENGRG